MKYTEQMSKRMYNISHESILIKELLGQNKDDHKIAINALAIDKIPYVRFPDISDADCEKIYDLEKMLLAISQNENNSNEVSITYKLNKVENESDDDRIAIVLGNEHEVELGADTKTDHWMYSENHAILANIHNHPGCSNFSVEDISTFCQKDPIKILILLTNKGELRYLLKTKDFDYNKAKLVSAKCYEKICQRPISELMVNSSKISIKNSIDIANDILKNANKFGAEYKHVLQDEKDIQYIRNKLNEKEKNNDYEQNDY